MNVTLIILLVAMVLVVVFYKDFRAFVYFTVFVDIFLRVVSYLKTNIIKDTALSFLDVVADSIPSIIKSLDFGVVNEILMFIYVVIYIIFEILIIKIFIKRKFK